MTDNAWDRAASPTFPIGAWVTRARTHTEGGYPLAAYVVATRAHLVESLVADDPVTRCGRRLRHDLPGTTLRYALSTERACYRCKR